ncbi:MAG TPA: carboxypeptidase-like regulatory domain-containing protein [Candidatus Binataceae bacterium]
MTLPKRLVLLAPLFAILVHPIPGLAGPHKGVVGKMQGAPPVVISGKVLTHEGQPVADREIHLENTVTGDAFLTSTGKDGSFSIAVPPAYYNLREEHGPIVAGYIWAQGDAINMGTVSEPGGLQYLLQLQRIAPAQIHSPAPITSNVRPGSPITPTDRVSPHYQPQ